MNRKYFYLLIIGLLVISNFATLFFALHKERNKSITYNPKQIIIERLDFNELQVIDYQELVDNHQEIILFNNKKINQLKQQLYVLLTASNDEQKIDSLTTEIGWTQKEIETLHYKHFQDIKSICKPHQIEKFDKLALELEAIFKKYKNLKKQTK